MRHRGVVLLLAAVPCAFALHAAEARRVDRVDPSRQGPQRSAEARGETVDLIVRFRQPAVGISTNAMARRRAAIEARANDLQRDLDRLDASDGARVRHTFHRVLFGASVRVPRELRGAVRALPYVASVHEDTKVQPLLAKSVPRIRAPQVWAQASTRGAGVTVAVIDTGIDYTHPAFGGGFGEGFKVAGGWDFVDGDGDPMDEAGHGTHVAGIVAGNGGGVVGVAPDASLLAYRVLGPQGGSASDVIAAIERCVDPNGDGDPSDHVDIVNMSLGGFAVENDPAAAAVENATAAGILFTISAGNWGDYGNILTPGIAPSAITVGAADARDRVADFSSRGPAFDFGIKPEVVAPGVGIVSAARGGGLVAADGTSMAAPHVAGVAALVKAVHPDWTPAEIKTAIVTSSIAVEDEVMTGGAGRIDAWNAATVATLVSPPVVSFGQVDALADVWTATRTVTLRNVSGATETLTASVQGNRDGVAVTVTPEVVELAPGASASVTIAISVTNAAVPAPAEGSLSFGGRVAWSGGAVPVHVPWAFVKGAFLILESPDAEGDIIGAILGSRWSRQTDFYWQSTRVFWPLEEVDVVLTEANGSARNWIDRIVVGERIDTFRTPRVVLPFTGARYRVVARTADETGGELSSGGRACVELLAFAFPSGRKFSRQQAPDFRPQYGPISERVKMHVLHSCGETANEKLYAAVHPPRLGLSGDVTSVATPQWLRQEVRFAGATEGHLTDALATLRFPGPMETYYFAGGSFFLMRPTAAALTILYADNPDPDIELMTLVERMTRCEPDGEAECTMYGMTFLYHDREGTRVDGDLYFDVSPMALRVLPGKTLILGSTPLWARQGFGAGPGFWSANASWRGPAGETRPRDFDSYRTVVRDAAGTVIAEAPSGGIQKWESLPRGRYSIESSNSGYAVNRIAGKATLTTSLDLELPDPFYPAFFGVRIEDGEGLQATTFERGAPATLLFSVADRKQEGPFVRNVPPREEAARVEYRRRGTSEWHSVPAVLHARHYQNNNWLNPGVGTMYRADLSEVTREVRGGVDLRIHAEDADGNAVELLLEPAMYVGDGGRGRVVRK